MRRWQNDAQAFATEALGEPFTDQQMPIVRSITGQIGKGGHKRTLVKSGNSLGKTNIAAKLLLWHGGTRPGYTLTSAPSWSQVQTKLWAEADRLYRRALVPLGGRWMPDSCRWKFGGYWFAHGVSTKDESNLHGGHTKHLFVMFDEAQGIPGVLWDAAEGMMQGEHARWLCIGNPLEARGRFYSNFRKRDEWNALTMSALEHPNVISGEELIPGAVTRDWVEERRREWGEEDPRFLARVLGQFPASAQNLVVSMGYLEKAAEDKGREDGRGLHVGVDVARFGDDESIISTTEDSALVTEDRYAGKDGNELAGIVIAHCRCLGMVPEDAPERIHVDSIGVGAALVDAMAAEGWYVDSVNFGAGPRNNAPDLHGEEMLFANLRAEAYWTVRELLRRGKAHVPAEFGKTWEELAEPTYKYNRRSALLVEEKDKVKARLNRSPDGADAYALALCRAEPGPTIAFG